MSISFKQLRQANLERDKEWNTGTEKVSLTFRGCELAGEAGEAANKLKKLERERLGMKGSHTSIHATAMELADVVICADLVAMDLGIDLSDFVRAAFNGKSHEHGFKTLLADVPVGLNQWIDDELSKLTKWHFLEDGTEMVSNAEAAEIARGAAVQVIMDKETLIGNLTEAGYVVLSPGEQSDILKALTEHNDMLRSTSAIASRDGKETNWSYFRSRVAEVLASGHRASNLARDVTNGLFQTDPSDFKTQQSTIN